MSDIAGARRGRGPVRLAHLGLSHFHRAHQAWYTQACGDPADEGWGIAAFTGRSPAAAEALAAQDGVYTLIQRSAEGDTAELIESIVAAHDGAGPRWEPTIADPAVAVLTVTVTERGYEEASAGAEGAGERILRGLRARAAAGAGSIALVSCDNLVGNGAALRRAVLRSADADTAAWIGDNVSFVSTMVDRITPHTTDEDRAVARALTGYDDRVPVVAEPFTEWILCGDFPAGRPAWELAGARFVEDVEPFERRKLWLLNAGHTLLATLGLPAGLATVAEAFGDAGCRARLEALWGEAREVLPFDDAELDAALEALRTRFANPRIAHRLSQIDDGSLQKLRQRQVAIIGARIEAGLEPGPAAVETIRAWGDARGLGLDEALDTLRPGLARRLADPSREDDPSPEDDTTPEKERP